MQPWMMGGMGMNMGPRMYQPQPQMVQETQQKIEEVKKEAEQANNVHDVTKNMVDVLSNSTNPKHRNSKFLKFLNKLNYGAYALENDQLVKNAQKIEEFRAIETQRRNEDLLREVKDKQIPEMQQEELFKDILNGERELGEEEYDSMMKEWMGDANQMQKMEDMMQEWQRSWDQSMQQQFSQFPLTDPAPTIAFQVNNPYMAQTSESQLDTRDNLTIAKALIEHGKV